MTEQPLSLIDELSHALISAHRSGCRVGAAHFTAPDYAQALAIQQRVQSALGAVGGFKVARRAEGFPVIAPICASRIVSSGSNVPVSDTMGIELEIGFELTGDPVAAADPDSAVQQHFLPRIVLELVDTRLEGAVDDPMIRLADRQINAGLVLGPALKGWSGQDFNTVDAFLSCAHETVVDGMVSVPGGSALQMLRLLIDHVGQHCGGLQTGQVIITGSLTGLLYFPAGTDVLGRITGFGEVSCRLV